MAERATHLRTIGGTVTGPAPAPVTARGPAAEMVVTDLAVTGALPAGLAGIHLRNGPNDGHPATDDPLAPTSAMLHAVVLGAGRAGYRSRQLPATAPTAGAPAAGVVVHAGRILAVGETGPPLRLDPQLVVGGTEDFGGALAEGSGPRPRRDPVWDELVTLRWSPDPPYATVTVLDVAGRARRTVPVGLDRPGLVREFGLTDTHVVCFDHPVRVAPNPHGPGLVRSWHPEEATRVGVVARDADGGATRWCTVDTREVLAVVNAWRDGDRIHVDHCCRPAPAWAAPDGPAVPPSRLVRTTVDLTTGRAADELLGVAPWGTPTIDERRTGLGYRYLFAATGVETDPTGEVGSALIRFDLSERSRREHRFPDGVTVGGPQFVPAAADAPEGRGWLLALTHDAATGRSALVVLDAEHPEREPVACVELPQPVPPTRGGTWLPVGETR